LLIHQRFPHGNEICRIDREHLNCDPANSRLADQFRSGPLKMLTPSVLPRVKQPNEFPSNWISSRNVRTFVAIAVEARKSEVFEGSYTAMLLGNDVIHMKGQRVRDGRQTTVFTTALCALPDLPDQV
jgi:hypothetical protein